MLLNRFFQIIDIQHNEKDIVKVRLNPDHEVYKGHFPGLPVAPGVCLVQMAKETLEQLNNRKLSMISCSNIKFTAVVNPNVQKELTMEMQHAISDDGQIHLTCNLTDGETKYLALKGSYLPKNEG